MRAGTAIVTLTAALALTTPAAAQETKWSLGESEYTVGINCTSIIFPPARLEQQTFAFAAQQVPVDGLPYAGDVFYARITFARSATSAAAAATRCPSSCRRRASRSSRTAIRTGL